MAEDLDLLCAFLTHFAQAELTKKGSFDSFGAVLDDERKLTLVAAVLTPEYNSPDKIVRFWFGALRQSVRGKNYRAAGFCCDVRQNSQLTGEKSQIAQVWLEHSDGRAQTVRFPCQKREDGSLSLGRPSSEGQEARVFTQPPAK